MLKDFPGGASGKDSPANPGDARDAGLTPGLGRSPGAGDGHPLQDSCLENLTGVTGCICQPQPPSPSLPHPPLPWQPHVCSLCPRVCWQVYVAVTWGPSHVDVSPVSWRCSALFHLWPFSPLGLFTHLRFPPARLAGGTSSVDTSYGPRAVSDCPLSKPWNGDFQWGWCCFWGDSMKLMETFFDCFTMRCY